MGQGGTHLRVRERSDAAFYQEYEPVRPAWICVEDRPAGFLHLQHAGGVTGLASSRAAAMERHRRSSFVGLGRSITVLAGISAHVVESEMEMLRHENCGREKYANEITQKIFQEPERVYPLANLIDDNLTPDEFDTYVSIYRAIHDARLIESDTQADQLLRDGGRTESGLHIPPVRRVPILNTQHQAERFKINRGRMAFDNEAAWDTEPSYNLSYGRLPEAHATLNRYLGHVPEAHFMAAVAIESAATALALEELTQKEFTFELVHA